MVMMRWGAIAVAVVLAVAGCDGGPRTGTPSDRGAVSAPALDDLAARDLDLLLNRLEAIHPEPFHGIDRGSFVVALRDLQRRLPGLTPDEATVEVMRLVALLSSHGRDGHEFALPQPGHEAPVLPLRIYEFSDGVFVTAARAPYAELTGAELTAIDGHPIAEVLAALEPLVPRDGPATVPAFRPVFLLRTEVLHGLGLIEADAPIELTVGARRVVSVEPIPFGEYVQWAGEAGMLRLPEGFGPPYRSRYDEILWSEPLGGGRTVYARYAEVRPAAPEALAALRGLLAAPAVERVVLDIRQNPGGDNHNNAAITDVLADFQAARPTADLVVLIDRVTFSAAANLAADLERELDPVFVGEAMGGGLNFWDDVTQVRLDHLPVPLQVGVSTRYWQRSAPEDPRLTITPDIAVRVLAEDFFAGADPALAAALALLPGG